MEHCKYPLRAINEWSEIPIYAAFWLSTSGKRYWPD